MFKSEKIKKSFRLKRFFSICLFLTFFTSFTAQDKVMDSLYAIIKSNTHDTVRFAAITYLIELENDEKVWLPLNEELLRSSEKRLRESDDPVLTLAYRKHHAVALANVAYYEESMGNVEKAVFYYKRALKILENTGMEKEIITIENNLGVIYMERGDISRSSEIFQHVLKVSEKWKDKRMIGRSLNNLGIIYQGQGNYQAALEFFERALKNKDESEDMIGISTTLNNIGYTYHSLKNREKAIEYYERSMKIREELKDKSGISGALLNIGSVYMDDKKFDQAYDHFNRALKISEELNEKAQVVMILASLSRVKIAQNKIEEALVLAKRGFAMSKELGYPEKIQHSADNLKAIYQKQGKYKEALEMYELYIRMSDSLSNESTRRASVRSQLKYEYEKQAAADSVAHAKDSEVKNVELSRQKAELNAKKNQQYVLFGGLFAVCVFGVFMYNRFKVTQKQKTIIEQQKEVVEEQKKLVEEKQKEVLDSIIYARRIQMALMPGEKRVASVLNKLKHK